MIETQGLTKRYGRTLAVDDLTFAVRPGVVTALVGPNGAGKTATIRMILGLATATRGAAVIRGLRYADLPSPLREVGALLDPPPGSDHRRVHQHLRWLVRSNGIPGWRVDEVLELAGLEQVADRRLATLSRGALQRLRIAAALVGDPAVVILDEPVSGLDPEGVRWVRCLVRQLADEGRTVLVASHAMHEITRIADRLVVIARGRLLADTTVPAALGDTLRTVVLVRADQNERLARLLRTAGATVWMSTDRALMVSGLGGAEVCRHAMAARVELSELTPQQASLEDSFLRLTSDDTEYRSCGGRR
jgi:ABC-2 type transport system ATP-binding protein